MPAGCKDLGASESESRGTKERRELAGTNKRDDRTGSGEGKAASLVVRSDVPAAEELDVGSASDLCATCGAAVGVKAGCVGGADFAAVGLRHDVLAWTLPSEGNDCEEGLATVSEDFCATDSASASNATNSLLQALTSAFIGIGSRTDD